LQALPLALRRRALRRWLIAAGLGDVAGWSEIMRLLDHDEEIKTWQVSLPGGRLARLRCGRLEILPAGGRPLACSAVLRVPGSVTVAGVRVTARRQNGIVHTPGPIGQLPSACSLGGMALGGRQLIVRTRRPGDRIRPLGMNGSRKVQDVLTDAKVPPEARDRLPLLVVDDNVVWIPGYRVARAFAARASGAGAVHVRMTFD
jgi:tRNA(Ile)-lysidine synthase